MKHLEHCLCIYSAITKKKNHAIEKKEQLKLCTICFRLYKLRDGSFVLNRSSFV